MVKDMHVNLEKYSGHWVTMLGQGVVRLLAVVREKAAPSLWAVMRVQTPEVPP